MIHARFQYRGYLVVGLRFEEDGQEVTSERAHQEGFLIRPEDAPIIGFSLSNLVENCKRIPGTPFPPQQHQGN